MTVIHSTDEIPSFATEVEERDFWATHSMGAELFEHPESPPDDMLPPVRTNQRRTTSIALRMDDDLLARLRAEARRQRAGYQTLLKSLVARGLDRAEYHGVLAGAVEAYEDGDSWAASDEVVEVEINRPLDRVIPVRLTADKWEALRAEARELGIGPTTLARMWLFERLRTIQVDHPRHDTPTDMPDHNPASSTAH